MRYGIGFFYTVILIVLSAASVTAQTESAAPEPCYLGLSDAPDFRSVRLGMSPQEIADTLKIELKLTDLKYEGSYRPERTDPLEDEVFVQDGVDVGSKVFYWNIISTDPREGFDGIKSFYFYFFEDRLYLIYSSYYDKDNHYFTAGLKTLTEDLSNKYDLPQKGWALKDNAVIKCQDFLVWATIYNKPVTMPDKGVWVTVVRDTAATDKLTRLIDQSVKEYFLTHRELILDKKREELRQRAKPVTAPGSPPYEGGVAPPR